MVGERNGNAIVVDGLFIDTDFQIGESEDIGTMGVPGILHPAVKPEQFLKRSRREQFSSLYFIFLCF